jgi:hypothetical protein
MNADEDFRRTSAFQRLSSRRLDKIADLMDFTESPQMNTIGSLLYFSRC